MGNEPVYCNGKMLPWKRSEFPANAEIINMISDQATKLTIAGIEIQNLNTQNASLKDVIEKSRNAFNEMHQDKIAIESDRRVLKAQVVELSKQIEQLTTYQPITKESIQIKEPKASS